MTLSGNACQRCNRCSIPSCHGFHQLTHMFCLLQQKVIELRLTLGYRIKLLFPYGGGCGVLHWLWHSIDQ